MKLCWEFTNVNVTLPNFWQMGINPEDKAAAGCLWEFSFHLLPRLASTESGVSVLLEPAKAHVCVSLLPTLNRWSSKTLPLTITKASGSGDRDTWSSLLEAIQFSRGAGFACCSSTHKTQVNATIWRAVASSKVMFIERPPPVLCLYLSPAPFSLPICPLRESESNFLLKWKSVLLPWKTFIHGQDTPYIKG